MSSPSESDCSRLLTRSLVAADRLLEVAEHGDVVTSEVLKKTPLFTGLLNGDVKKESRDLSLEERLLELHIEESAKATSQQGSSGGQQHHLNPCSNLVDLLCRRDRCNRLLITLLPNNEGYSVHVSTGTTTVPCNELLFRVPYEDYDDFLSYIDNEELPVSVIDLLEKEWPELFYSGCVIAEIRDRRRIGDDDDAQQSSHVLLRPTTQSIICDSNLMLCEGATLEERAALEGQLLVATQPPLCLDPDPVVSVLARKSSVHRTKFATPEMRRSVRKYSQLGINRKRKLDQTRAPPELRLYDFIQQQANKQQQNKKTCNTSLLAERRNVIMMSNGYTQQLMLENPTSTDVAKHSRAIQKRAEVNDMTPHVVEEYILETAERGAARIYHTRLTIYQRLANDEYLGELYVERDFREKDKKGSTCRFVLGTRPHALRYINQFTEIFTEEGRKSVKITHLVPNQPPRVTFTPGMRERMNERAAALAAAAANQQVKKAPTNSAPAAAPSILQQTLSAPTIQQQLRPQQQSPATPMVESEQEPPPPHIITTGSGDQQEIAISAIMQSLMKDTAQFEVEQQQNNTASTAAAKPSIVGGAQLPTCPVPAASLAVTTTTSPVKNNGQQLLAKRVSLQNLLNAQVVQQPKLDNNGSPVKVSQLAAQLSRPTAAASLPSYTQALADQQQASVVQSSPRPRLLVTQQQQQQQPPPPSLLRSTGSLDNKDSLQALLSSNSDNSDNNSNSSLLERLVSGGQTTNHNNNGSTSSSPVSSNSSISRQPDSTNDITLAALLSKPSSSSSPTKMMSPLLQQLQQPIPPPIRQTSPRIIQPSSAPFTQQQQLMQPPKINLQELQQQQQQNGSPNGVVSLQHLIQGGMVQVTSATSNATTTSIPVQMSIPGGLYAPITFSVNVPDQQQQQNNSEAAKTLMQTAGKLVPTSTVVTVAAANSALCGPTANIIQLPQQPTSAAAAAVVASNNLGPQMQSNHQIIKSGQVLQCVRQPLYLQMPSSSASSNVLQQPPTSSQSIQIVRSVGQQQNPLTVRSFQQQPQQQIITTAPQLVLNSVNTLKSSPSMMTLQQQQQQHVAIQLQDPNILLAPAGQKLSTGAVNNSSPVAAASNSNINHTHAQIRLRQQRKQSLK